MAIWITGCGAVTAAGPTVDDLADAVCGGRSTIRSVPELGGLTCAAIDRMPSSRSAGRVDRSAALFVAAAEQAWRDAGLEGAAGAGRHTAVIEGSALGPLAAALTAQETALMRGGACRARPRDIS